VSSLRVNAHFPAMSPTLDRPATSDPDGPVADVIAPGLDALFVGINPGFASARAGHHFANPANPFWRLLHESGLVARRLTPVEERALLDHGLGLTNLVPRATGGVADLTRDDLERGRQALVRKIQRYRPRAVVFVGLTAYAAFERRRRPRTITPSQVARRRIRCGEQPDRFAGARVFVVPNPSGRNAHFTRLEMRAAFRRVARALDRARRGARGAWRCPG
jgi:double-stranded uracil-DNA glycosylase